MRKALTDREGHEGSVTLSADLGGGVQDLHLLVQPQLDDTGRLRCHVALLGNDGLLDNMLGYPVVDRNGGEDDAGRYARVRGSDVVQFGQDIAVEANELVNGNVVSIASDIRIDGKVTGDVAAIFGSVSLGPEAIVSGEVVSIFGSVEREDGSVIRGETAVIGGGCGGRGLVYPITAFGESVIGGVAKIVAFIIGILLMLILVFFMPGRMRRAADFTGGSFLKSAAMGLLLFFGGLVLVVILAIILAITIVGIPVAILLVLSFAALLGIG